ncbi:UDP-N-acetylmuramate dehydrogenase [Noviherbaspirillum saxi]|uniref:UDP-N-acetylenolpyruvoylglucosamine reductase n=1 Tax=Noviherbaspirillum saxi TaxID=2320863 RepID=A0A3A3FU40_9BURK|nr:UDP-N-acetylmuramate dehydrogenase [Noviherbaspirillum saxi]RJF98038.1 UDP-N-acetylmuramate dehydrogenase [Noviherbaspirillum saxi]
MTAALPIRHNFPLRHLNTFGIDAQAHAYLPVTSNTMLDIIRRDAQWSTMPRLVLGGGSNLILTGDYPGLVLHMATQGIAVIAEDQRFTYVKAAAGENWHRFVLWTLDHGMGGLENLSLIPGSVGAAPIQNIGAYGVEIKDCFHALTAYDFKSGELLTLNAADCGFAYRDSIFKHAFRDRAVILDVTFALPKQWQANLQYADVAQELASSGIATPSPSQVSDAVIAIRARKLPDPAKIGNAGSFFKNPVVSREQRDALLTQHAQLVSYAQADGTFKLAAGWLIDQCGWKGKTLGAAGVYEKQALVLVNRGGAKGRDVTRLAEAIQADVMARFSVRLEPEPVFV